MGLFPPFLPPCSFSPSLPPPPLSLPATITEVGASEYEPQVVELPSSPPPGARQQEGHGEEEDDRGKEEAESQNNEGVRHVSMCKPVC